ncbi:MAG: glycosyltransferase family 4 protein [Caldilineaceae bacterium]|nr:glycosyltransferase family 4 protein [Caldilineaceae bacterium]
MTIAQILTPAVGFDDATGAHTIQLWDALQPRFEQINVYTYFAPGKLPGRIGPFVHQVDDEHRSQADLTIVQYPLWYPLAERIRDMRGRKLFWYHGVTPPELWSERHDRELLRNSQIRTALAWHTHLAAVTSPYTGEELAALSGLPDDRLRVVPLGLDPRRIAAAPDFVALHALRDDLGLQDRRVLLFIGRIAGNKRIDLLIDALAELRRAHDDFADVALLVVGDSSYNAAAQELDRQLRQRVEAEDLVGQVIFTGRVAEISPYLHLADCVILPSEHEGFGLPAVEAMAAGVPVITAAAGALPWVLQAGTETPAGLIFAPGDVGDLTRQIRRVLGDAGLRADLIRNGHARAVALSQEAFAANTLRLADEVMTMPEADTTFNALVSWTLYPQADTMLRNYRIRSNAPYFAPRIEQVRRNLTSHLKEPYIDQVFERQVRYNRLLATEIEYLHAEMRRLEARMDKLQAGFRIAQGEADHG